MVAISWTSLIGLFLTVAACVFIAGCTMNSGYSTPTVTPTISPTPSQPATPIPSIPPSQESTSVNWAGYVVQTSFGHPQSNAIDAVEAKWIVSEVKCSGTAGDYSASFWIGIDGYSSQNLVQIGTESDCTRGLAQYYAWYEVLPQTGVVINGIDIGHGDLVHASVEYTGNDTFLLIMNNTSNGDSFSTTVVNTGADRNSAEWIVEAPVYHGRILPLSDFGPLDFENTSVTVNGVTGPIINPGWSYQAIIMEARNGTIKATPTFLSEMGSRFRIFWEHP